MLNNFANISRQKKAIGTTLIWWKTAAAVPEPINSVQAHKGWIRAIAVSPDGALIASGGNDKVVRIWNLADGSPVREMTGHEKGLQSLWKAERVNYQRVQ